MDDYIDKVAVPQVKEILTHYGEFPAVLWWDTPVDMNKERAEKLLPLLKLKPGIIYNNRLGGGYQGRHRDPGAVHPRHRLPGPRLGDLHDHERHLGLQELRQQLEERRNAHPQPGGHRQQRRQLPAQRRPHLRGPHPGPFRRAPQGDRPMDEGRTARRFTAPPPAPSNACLGAAAPRSSPRTARSFTSMSSTGRDDGKLLVPGLKNTAQRAYLLADPAKQALAMQSGAEGLDPFRSRSRARPGLLHHRAARSKARWTSSSPAWRRTTTAPSCCPPAKPACTASEIKYETGDQRDNLGFWTNPDDWADWTFKVTRPGKFEVTREIAALEQGLPGGFRRQAAAPGPRQRQRGLRQIQSREPGLPRNPLPRQSDPGRPPRQRRLAPAEPESDPPEAGSGRSVNRKPRVLGQ